MNATLVLGPTLIADIRARVGGDSLTSGPMPLLSVDEAAFADHRAILKSLTTGGRVWRGYVWFALSSSTFVLDPPNYAVLGLFRMEKPQRPQNEAWVRCRAHIAVWVAPWCVNNSRSPRSQSRAAQPTSLPSGRRWRSSSVRSAAPWSRVTEWLPDAGLAG